MDPQARLAELGVELPEPPQPAAAYSAWITAGDLIFTAGQLPVASGELVAAGRVGQEVTTAEGTEAARVAAVNLLAVADAAAGGLDRVRAVKLTVFVASTPDFAEQHLVANGASTFISEVLGDHGEHARSAVGVAALPKNSPVEVEGIFARLT